MAKRNSEHLTNYWQNQSRSTHICHHPQTISCVICFYFPLSYYLILHSLCCIDCSFILSNTQISASLRSHHPTEQLIGTDLTNRYLARCHHDISILVLFMCMCVIHVCVIHVCMMYVCAPIGTHRGQRRMLWVPVINVYLVPLRWDLSLYLKFHWSSCLTHPSPDWLFPWVMECKLRCVCSRSKDSVTEPSLQPTMLIFPHALIIYISSALRSPGSHYNFIIRSQPYFLKYFPVREKFSHTIL